MQDIINMGGETTFTKRELQKYGIVPPKVKMTTERIKSIRKKLHLSQTVFAYFLDVTPSSVRHWEQGDRQPSGPIKILLDMIDRNPRAFDHRMPKLS